MFARVLPVGYRGNTRSSAALYLFSASTGECRGNSACCSYKLEAGFESRQGVAVDRPAGSGAQEGDNEM